MPTIPETSIDAHHYIAVQAEEINRLSQDRMMLAALVRQLEAQLAELRQGARNEGE